MEQKDDNAMHVASHYDDIINVIKALFLEICVMVQRGSYGKLNLHGIEYILTDDNHLTIIDNILKKMGEMIQNFKISEAIHDVLKCTVYIS